MFEFKWNSKGNLEGWALNGGQHKFTWQPHGSQFTIIEEVPDSRLHIRIKQPKKLDKADVWDKLNFNETWYEVLT